MHRILRDSSPEAKAKHRADIMAKRAKRGGTRIVPRAWFKNKYMPHTGGGQYKLLRKEWTGKLRTPAAKAFEHRMMNL